MVLGKGALLGLFADIDHNLPDSSNIGLLCENIWDLLLVTNALNRDPRKGQLRNC